MPSGIFIRDEKWRESQRVAHLGKKHSVETRNRMSEIKRRLGMKPPSRKGVKLSIETRQKMSESHRARDRRRARAPISDETRRKMSESHKGEKSSTWAGGISKPNPYPREFNPTLKLKIRTRDGFKCARCPRTEQEELGEFNRVLCVNHIDFNKNNCDEKNLNTLCLRCNIQINRERGYWESYFKSRTAEGLC